MYNTTSPTTLNVSQHPKVNAMSTRNGKVRKAFFGLWIATAALLLMVGRAGGAIDGIDASRMAPSAVGHVLPSLAVEVVERGGPVVD